MITLLWLLVILASPFKSTSNHLKYRLPCLVMLPSLSLPSVVRCFGINAWSKKI
jgi:hypothetical protein